MTRWNRPVVLGYLYIILVENYWAWVILGCVLLGLAAKDYLGWGWAFFGLAVILNIMSRNYEAKKSNHLISYLVYLLLDDDIRENQKKHFRECIRSENVTDAMVLTRRARAAIERSAEALAAGDPQQPLSGSTYASHAMIWKVKNQP